MTTVPEQRDADTPGVAPGRPERAAYGAQPHKTDRPLPVRHSDEAPDHPSQWDSASTEPSQPRGTDDIKDERARVERESRVDLAAGTDAPAGDDTDGTHDDAESAYASEREQGAAQPGTSKEDGS
jgi:hypothetical protein